MIILKNFMLMLHRVIKQFIRPKRRVLMLCPRMPNRPTYDFSSLFAMHRCCRVDGIDIARGVVIAIMQRRPPSQY